MITQIFNSLEEFMGVEEHSKNRNHYIVKTKYEDRDDWLGVGINTVPELKKEIKNGWPQGVRKMMELKEKIEYNLLPPKVLRKRKSRGDFGDEIDIQRVYAGDLERAWTRSTRQMVVGIPVVRVLVSIGGLASRSAEDLFYKGVGAAILTDILEEQGYRVEIVAYSRVKDILEGNPREQMYIELPVKEAKEPLDLQRITIITALSGFFRYYMFKTRLSLPCKITSYMGVTVETPPEEVSRSGDIILNNIYSEREVIEAVERELRKLGLGEGR